MSKLNTVNGPNWTKNQIRDVKKLWLDKNENIDIHLSNKINSIIKKIPPHSIFGYPHLNFIYEKLSSIFKVLKKICLYAMDLMVVLEQHLIASLNNRTKF